MPRKRKKSSPLPWMLAAAGLLVLTVLAVVLFQDDAKETRRTTEALDVAVYLENANSLRGNVYQVEGTIDNQLAWSETQGRLISLSIKGKGGTDLLAILVPAKLNHINLQRGQRFAVEVEIGDKGIISARSLKKT